jgi:two-component system, NtrC family, sensor histidine kinase AtoS
MLSSPLLQTRNIRYSYGSLKVLQGIDFDLYPGEIHAITGDHGSGKSTLIQIIAGTKQGQVGTIKAGNKSFTNLSPSDARQAGISIVHQDQKILPHASVFDNVYLGQFPFLLFKRKKEHLLNECRRLFGQYHFDVDPLTKVYQLPVAKRQLLSVMRVIALKTDIIILDEIAQKTTPEIQEHIYHLLRLLRNDGKGIIYSTSNIDELFKIADRVTILQEGHRRGTEVIDRVDHSRLVNLAFSFAIDSEVKEKPGNHEMLILSRYDKKIINDIPQGLMIISPSNEIQDINRSASAILSHAAEDVKGKKLADLFHQLPIEKGDEILQAIVHREKKLWQKLRYKKDQFLKIRLSPLGEEQEDSQGALLFIEDISSDQETREYLLQAEKYISTAELAAGVAHEVNNPLGIIQNYLDLLRLERLSGDGDEYIEHIQSELTRIVEIISSLLSFSKVGNRSMHRLDLNKLLDEVLLLMGHQLKRKKVKIIRNFTANGVVIKGHENKLKQLFINLISNANDAVLVEGKIEISTRSGSISDGDEYAEITITDNGHGIPEEIQEQIFTPFYSTKVTKTNTGLGLSICQHIVESYNGILSVHSVPGDFTTFAIRLPR